MLYLGNYMQSKVINRQFNRRKSSYLIISILLVALMIYIARVLDMAMIGSWLKGIDGKVASMGLWAVGIIFALRSISIIIPILPGTYCSVLSGYFFGFQQGLLVIFIADLVACCSCFTLSRKFGRTVIENLVGKRLMSRVEKFSKKHLEQNFFLMTSFLMSNLFDFVCYGLGLTKVTWKKFLPALLFSIIISDAPFIASGYALKRLGGIEIQEIISGNVKALQGQPLIIFIASIAMIFSLAIINMALQRRQSNVK